MKPSADNKLPYITPTVKVVAFRVERGFENSNMPPAPDFFELERLLGSQESPVQYTEAGESTGWCSDFE